MGGLCDCPLQAMYSCTLLVSGQFQETEPGLLPPT